MVLLCIAFMEERESVENLGMMKNLLVSTFPFLNESNTEKPNLRSSIITKTSLITFSAKTGLSETLLGPG